MHLRDIFVLVGVIVVRNRSNNYVLCEVCWKPDCDGCLDPETGDPKPFRMLLCRVVLGL